jgi:hypothetical protein
MCSEEHPDASRIVPPEGFPIHTTPIPKNLCRALQFQVRRPFTTCSSSSEEPLPRCSSRPEDPSPRAAPDPKILCYGAVPGPKTLHHVQLQFRRTFATVRLRARRPFATCNSSSEEPSPRCNSGSEDPLSHATPTPRNLRCGRNSRSENPSPLVQFQARKPFAATQIQVRRSVSACAPPSPKTPWCAIKTYCRKYTPRNRNFPENIRILWIICYQPCGEFKDIQHCQSPTQILTFIVIFAISPPVIGLHEGLRNIHRPGGRLTGNPTCEDCLPRRDLAPLKSHPP